MTLVYPGSFDPVTLGHIDIATRGAKLATRLIVAVLDNTSKQSLFTINERVSFLQDALAHLPNVEIDSFSGLLANYARAKNANAILRGLRTAQDFEAEARYAAANSLLLNDAQSTSAYTHSAGQASVASLYQCETVFIAASPALSFISSSIVREAAYHMYSNIQSNSSHDAALQHMTTPLVVNSLKKVYSSSHI